jgi:opacity protein-like surface antigen
MTRHRFALGAAFIALAAATPLSAQIQDWQHKWFWGFKGGMLGYTLPTTGRVFVPQFGAEWLITGKRTALYVGYSQSATQERADFTFTGIATPVPVIFDAMRRIQLGVLVLPTNSAFQPYAGAGFVIETLTNAHTDATPVLSPGNQTTADRALADQSAGGFALIMAGLQLRMGRKLAFYGHYQGSPQGRAFLLAGSSHSFEFGLRYAFLGAREDDVTSRH